MTLAKHKAPKKVAPKKVAPTKPAISASELLAWYARHRRKLPWRAEGGARPDPYHIWLSEIMLQQTTVKAVGPYYARFLSRWPRVTDLATDRLEEVLKLWAGLGYYARARNLHACARAVVENYGGVFPDTEAELLKLPGVGAYTAAAIAAIAFDRKATVVDGNVERVVTRLFAIEQPLPAAKPAIRAATATLTPEQQAGDFAQAMMDLGATICTPKKPACVLCPWNEPCLARQRGDQDSFPRKTAKAEGKLRRGAAFVVLREDGALLARTRPDKGLLAAMTEVPTTDWSHDFDDASALDHAPIFGAETSRKKQGAMQWHRIPGVVSHVFTHFPLELVVYRTVVANTQAAPSDMRWIAAHNIAGEAFPNVMRKVIVHATETVRHDNHTTDKRSGRRA